MNGEANRYQPLCRRVSVVRLPVLPLRLLHLLLPNVLIINKGEMEQMKNIKNEDDKEDKEAQEDEVDGADEDEEDEKEDKEDGADGADGADKSAVAVRRSY